MNGPPVRGKCASVADEDEGRVLGAGQRYEQGQPSHSAAGRWGMVVGGVVRCP